MNFKNTIVKILLLGLFSILFFSGCTKEPLENKIIGSNDGTTDINIIDDKDLDNLNNENSQIETKKAIDFALAPLTGLPLDENMPIKRPIVVMLDNHFGARPQAGISQADHMYEIYAEGRITRYMAVFHSKIPKVVGPIRSARPYFIDKALEYKPYYVHVGGSMQALTDIINLKMGDIDGLSSGTNVFWRKKHKKIPHNMYSNVEAIQNEGERRGHIQSVEIPTWNFKSDKYKDNFDNSDIIKSSSDKKNNDWNNPYHIDWENRGVKTDDDKIKNVFEAKSDNNVEAKELMIFYKNPSSRDKLGYFISYQYNFDNGVYDRFVNGVRQFDEIDEIRDGKGESDTNKGICAKNIIVQIANHRVIDKEGRREIDLVGSGKGYYLSGGIAREITWSKKSRRDISIYKYKNGDEIKFEPGNIWFQIVENTDKTYISND